MSYIEKNLISGESIVYRGQLHWAVCLPAIFLGGFGILLCFAGASAAIVGVLILLFLALPTGVGALVSMKTSEFAVTNKRVLMKTGFISRKSFEILLAKIEGISADQGILGRIFNYGTIVISGTGGSKEIYQKVSDPLRFRREVQEQIEKKTEPAAR